MFPIRFFASSLKICQLLCFSCAELLCFPSVKNTERADTYNEIKSVMDEATFDTYYKIEQFARKQIIYSVSGAITRGFA